MKRDLSQSQFVYRAQKLGFKSEGFWGYWKLTDGSTAVSVLNAGNRRRDQLRYLINQDKRNNERNAKRQQMESA